MLSPRRLEPQRRRSVDNPLWHWTVNVAAASPAVGMPARARILRRAGIAARTALVQPGCFFFSSRVQLGDWSWINHRCYFDSRDEIVIGARCALGMEVMLCTSGHAPGDAHRRGGAYEPPPITIGHGVWIGTRATILQGVTIADSCIVAAGAVVTSDLESHGVYAGVPARRIRDPTNKKKS